MIEQLVFYVFAFIVVLSALGVLMNVRNTVYAALSLVVTMLSLAVLFILLRTEFMGVIQVMVYAGAIVVLFLFVIMLLNVRSSDMGADRQPMMKLAGTLIVGAAAAKLVTLFAVFHKPWPEDLAADFGSVRSIGEILYTDYLLAFEISGILLLAGIVGAVVLAKQRID